MAFLFWPGACPSVSALRGGSPPSGGIARAVLCRPASRAAVLPAFGALVPKCKRQLLKSNKTINCEAAPRLLAADFQLALRFAGGFPFLAGGSPLGLRFARRVASERWHGAGSALPAGFAGSGATCGWRVSAVVREGLSTCVCVCERRSYNILKQEGLSGARLCAQDVEEA